MRPAETGPDSQSTPSPLKPMESDTSRPVLPRIFYLHGIDPHAKSLIQLVHLPLFRDASESVLAPRMRTGICTLANTNSMLRHTFRQTTFRVCAALALCGAVAAICVLFYAPDPPRATILLPAAFGGGVALVLLGVALSVRGAADDAIGATVSIASQALAYAKAHGGVDMVVGQSWGAAVATVLLSRGEWAGPTLLIAPGTSPLLMRSKRWRGAAALPEALPRGHLLAVVGDKDVIVNTRETQAWCAAQNVECEVLPRTGHAIGFSDDTRASLLRCARTVAARARAMQEGLPDHPDNADDDDDGAVRDGEGGARATTRSAAAPSPWDAEGMVAESGRRRDGGCCGGGVSGGCGAVSAWSPQHDVF